MTELTDAIDPVSKFVTDDFFGELHNVMKCVAEGNTYSLDGETERSRTPPETILSFA